MHEHLRAGVRDVGALRRDTRGGRLEKRRDKKMLRRCLLLQELFFFFQRGHIAARKKRGNYAGGPAGLFLFPLSGLCENTFKSGRSLIASIE